MNTAKIRYIPTELNYINYTNNRLKHHSSGITWASRLIIILFIWCAGITGVLIHNYISDNEGKLNQTIINQEGIPLKNITPDELEVIND